jgi:hypothetical protein
MTAEQRARRDSLKSDVDRLKQEYLKLNNAGNAYIGQFTDPDTIYQLRRGDVMQRGDVIPPGPLSRCAAAGTDFAPLEDKPEPERRLALARWITNPNNPLTSRVIVNRIWHGHFGRGIVGTPSDFGRNGERPSHPELLDWLAAAFAGTDHNSPGVQAGVHASFTHHASRITPESSSFRLHPSSLKSLHRLIVTSNTYRQSSAANPAGQAKDAGNHLLWRAPLRRMEAEAIRDSILQTSGKLDRKMGGPSFLLYKYKTVNVAIFEPLEVYGPETWRRSIYQQAARGIHDELLSTFDCPESSQRAPKRDSTTTALQSLAMLNGPFMVQQSGLFAERVKSAAGPGEESQVKQAFILALGRPPRPEEAGPAAALVKRQGLPALCRALLNANEFLYY